MDSKDFRINGAEMINYVAHYLDNIEQRKVFPNVEPGYLHKLIPTEAPLTAQPWEDIIKDIDRVIMPGITHWHHPHFHAYFATANSYASICGDILSGGIGCVGFTWASSPSCTELEVVMMDWLAKAMGLPSFFMSESKRGGGVIYNTASEATLTSLLAARNKSIDEYLEINPKDNKFIAMSKLVGYYSMEAHSSVERAGLLSMIQLKPVPTQQRRMTADTLLKMIEEDVNQGFIPFFVVVTLGTTGSCVFDELDKIGPLCTEKNIWLHIDAAYAGSSFICPENQHYLQGVEHAMSYVFNAHKWLLVNFDCSGVWFKETRYVIESFTVDPTYLKYKQQGKYPDFRHWHIPLGRRFRSLKVWFVLRLYGIEGLQKYIRNHINLAKEFEIRMRTDDRFEIVEEVTMALVCFRLKGNNELNRNLHSSIETDGRIHLIVSHFHDVNIFYLRFSVCYQYATIDHIEYAFRIITEMADKLIINNNINETG